MKTWKSMLSFFSSFLLTLIVAFPASAQTKPIELTYSIFFPAPHKNTVLADEWAKEIGKRTQGKVKITVFPGRNPDAGG